MRMCPRTVWRNKIDGTNVKVLGSELEKAKFMFSDGVKSEMEVSKFRDKYELVTFRNARLGEYFECINNENLEKYFEVGKEYEVVGVHGAMVMRATLQSEIGRFQVTLPNEDKFRPCLSPLNKPEPTSVKENQIYRRGNVKCIVNWCNENRVDFTDENGWESGTSENWPTYEFKQGWELVTMDNIEPGDWVETLDQIEGEVGKGVKLQVNEVTEETVDVSIIGPWLKTRFKPCLPPKKQLIPIEEKQLRIWNTGIVCEVIGVYLNNNQAVSYTLSGNDIQWTTLPTILEKSELFTINDVRIGDYVKRARCLGDIGMPFGEKFEVVNVTEDMFFFGDTKGVEKSWFEPCLPPLFKTEIESEFVGENSLVKPNYCVVDKDMPNPTEKDLKSKYFKAIYDTIKSWNVNVPEYYEGYCGADGSHAKLIYDSLGNLTDEIMLGKLKDGETYNNPMIMQFIERGCFIEGDEIQCCNLAIVDGIETEEYPKYIYNEAQGGFKYTFKEPYKNFCMFAQGDMWTVKLVEKWESISPIQGLIELSKGIKWDCIKIKDEHDVVRTLLGWLKSTEINEVEMISNMFVKGRWSRKVKR